MTNSTKTDDSPIEGMTCPRCGQQNSFDIAVRTTVRIGHEGNIDNIGDTEWDDDSRCACPRCSRWGRVIEFRDNQN